jgi:hypothetical protein
LSHRSGSTALQPKIPKKDFEKLYAKIDNKDLFKEFYEYDENNIVDKLYLLKNRNELKYEGEQITEKEKLKIYDKKAEELFISISEAVETLCTDRTFDSSKRDHYLSSSNTIP